MDMSDLQFINICLLTGEVNEKKRNKTLTLNVEKDDDTMDETGEDNSEEDKEADAYQHVKQASKNDVQVEYLFIMIIKFVIKR